MKKSVYELTEKEVEQEIIARYQSESQRPETKEQKRIAAERIAEANKFAKDMSESQIMQCGGINMKQNYLQEARKNFEERMESQSPRPMTEEQRRIAEERIKRIEERATELRKERDESIRIINRERQ